MRLKPADSTAAILLLSIFFSCTAVHGSGYGVYTHGASALGQANASVAHADDPSAIFLNPALINGLDGTQVSVGTTAIFSAREFSDSETGNTFKSSNISYPSTFYMTHKFNELVSAGLGVFSPFGLANEWSDQWQGRYIATRSDMETFNINPVISVQVTPKISVAAGIDILFLDATLEKKIRLTPLPDASQKFKGDGTGVGYNLGVLFAAGKDVTFGAAYRSEVKININGNATFTAPQGVPEPIAALLQDAGGKTEVTLPQQAHAGICYSGLHPLTIEVGVRWEGWSSFESLNIYLADGRSAMTNRNWSDVFAYNIGGRYSFNERLAVLAGYQYGDSPTPNETFDPSIPDSPTHLFTTGAELDYRTFKLSLAYGYQMLERRTKNNDIGISPITADRANGNYDTDLHVLGVSLSYRF